MIGGERLGLIGRVHRRRGSIGGVLREHVHAGNEYVG